MPQNTKRWLSFLLMNVWLIRSARTAIEATIALAVATLFHLLEPYWMSGTSINK